MFNITELNDVFAEITADETTPLVDRQQDDLRKIVAADTTHLLHFNG